MKSMYSQVMEIDASLRPALARSFDVPSRAAAAAAAWPPAATLLSLISASCARAIVSRVWRCTGRPPR